MKEKVPKGVMWNEAAKTGVILGLIPVVYMFLTQLTGKMGSSHAVLTGLINFLLWAAKFGGCIWLMIVFMKKFAADYKADNSETFRYGVIVALCSSVIVAAVQLANVLLISPDLLSSQLDAVIDAYGSSLDSNTVQAVDKVKDILPQLTFFSNLIYCFLFGLILSYILSRNIPPRNILVDMIDQMRREGRLARFENKPDEQDLQTPDEQQGSDSADEQAGDGRENGTDDKAS